MKRVTQEQVGDRLATLRKRAGFTQTQVAEKLGVSPETISRLERGTQWTDFNALVRIAELYQVEWVDLLAVVPEGEDARRREAIQKVVDLLSRHRLTDIERAQEVLEVFFKKEDITND